MGAPALIDAQSTKVLQLLNAMIDSLNNVVAEGGHASDGGTTQASGANTAPNIDIDTTAIPVASVGGVGKTAAAGTDVDADAGDQLDWDATSGVEAVGDVVLTDTDTFVIVFGDVAPTGSALPPESSHFEAVLGAGVPYALASRITVVRTGDTTITVAVDDTARLQYAGVFNPLAETEPEFANSGFPREFPITTDPPLA